MKKIILLCLIGLSNLSYADNGVLSINDVCDGFGCFPGDTAGLPVTINNSGSYQLTSNIVSASSTARVIQINADNVTLDLNGFSIIGPRTCTGNGASLACSNAGMTAEGIYSLNRSNIVVKNGTVKGFKFGIQLSGATSNLNQNINHITATENSTGIVPGTTGIVSNCVTNRNIIHGINALLSLALISDTIAIGNKGSAVWSAGGVCSNVYFNNNGSTADSCARYTNDSTCEGLVACP